jgi:lipopolysaccharide biosynthesis glycosyltransferase
MTNQDDNSIVVVCAADDNYAMPLAVTVRSAIENLQGDRKIILFIIDGGIKDRNKRKICQSLPKDKCEIEWIPKPDSKLGRIQVLRGFSEEPKYIKIAAYYRLLISELLPQEYNKAIYLDSDLLVVGDLGLLWDKDIGNYYLMAVQDLFTPYVSSPLGLKNYRELGLSSNSKYLQSGVLLLNLEKWHHNDIAAQCIKYLLNNREYVRWHDTDVLNAVLANKWGELDPKWNLVPQTYRVNGKDISMSEEDHKDLINNPYIIHFSTYAKPWNSKKPHPAKHLFFHYLDMTAWKGWRLTVWRRAWLKFLKEKKKFESLAKSVLK